MKTDPSRERPGLADEREAASSRDPANGVRLVPAHVTGPMCDRAPDSNGTDKLLIDMVELARLTSIGVRTLRRMDASRDIPGRVVVRRCVRFQTEIICEWVRLGLPGRDEWSALQKRSVKR
ncbi:MAG: hypothetical protein EXR98_20025 [Gemmataceae bacterium]|nr:hypothetical protein [Gemmataceae bacterium]